MSHGNPSPQQGGPGHGAQPPVTTPPAEPDVTEPIWPRPTFVSSVDRHLLFEQLSEDELARIDKFSSIRTCKEGETLYRAGAPASHIYVNLHGVIYLLLAGHASKSQPLLSEVLAGEIFGVASVVGSRRYTTDAVTAQECRILSIEAQPFLGLLHNNPLAGMRFTQGVARVYMDRYLDLMRHM